MSSVSPERLTILVADYEAAREDERTLAGVQATMFGLALTALSIIGFFMVSDCRIVTKVDCYNTPDYVIAAAPLVPLALIAYMQIIGSSAMIKSFYMRVLERDIRSAIDAGDRNLRSYAGLPIVSSVELIAVRTTLRQGLKGPRVLTFMLFLAVLVVFGGVAAASIWIVPWHWRLIMIAFYVGGALFIVKETSQLTSGARELFQETVREAAARRSDSLVPNDNGKRKQRRSLMSYLLLPRPADLIKTLFFPVAYAVGATTMSTADYAFSLEGLVRGLILWTSLELLIYQSRYQFNDINGIDDDRDHPYTRARGRLPVGDGSKKSIAQAVWISGLVAVARLYAVLVLATVPSLDVWRILGIYLLGVYGIAGVYELLRRLRPNTPIRTRITAWAIYITVGFGYALRGMAGYLAATPSASFPDFGTWLPLAIFLAIFGSMLVVHTWALEACSYCLSPVHAKVRVNPASVGVEWLVALRSKPHLKNLLNEMNVNLKGPGLRTHESNTDTLGAYSQGLTRRGKFSAAPNVLTIVGSILSAIAGVCLVTKFPSPPVPPTWVVAAPLIALVGSIGICLGSPRLRWVSTLTVSGFLVYVTYRSGVPFALACISALPWLLFATTACLFRQSSFRDITLGFRGALLSMHIYLKLTFGFLMGKGAADALGLSTLRGLASLKVHRRRDKRRSVAAQADQIE